MSDHVPQTATLGLWEVIGTPTEGYFKGFELSVEVTYDAEDRVAQVVPLKGEEEINRNLNPDGTVKPAPKPEPAQAT